MTEVIMPLVAPITSFDTTFNEPPSTTTPSESLHELTKINTLLEIVPDLPSIVAQLPHGPSSLALTSLPTELHLMIFNQLDPIDSTCLGLTCYQLYQAYRRKMMKVSVPLNARRKGPNNLESAWKSYNKVPCRHCGIFRCELHKHIRGLFPPKYEYCHVRGVYGLCPDENAKAMCYRNCPSKPMSCGRHVLLCGEDEENTPEKKRTIEDNTV
jgi:hypothetical protein